MSLTSMSGSLIQVVSSSTFETMAWCLVGLLMIGQIFASSSELEWPIAHASHEVVDWAVTHCRAIHGCDSSSTVEWSKRVHTCQVEAVMCGGVYGCIWVCVGVYHGDMVYPENGWRDYVMAVDGGSHNGFLGFFAAGLQHLGACHASSRPAYLLVLVDLF